MVRVDVLAELEFDAAADPPKGRPASPVQCQRAIKRKMGAGNRVRPLIRLKRRR
jgi:hypothetical protein